MDAQWIGGYDTGSWMVNGWLIDAKEMLGNDNCSEMFDERFTNGFLVVLMDAQQMVHAN